MVKRPTESSGGGFVPEGFDETRSYRVKLLQLEERESQYGKPGDMALIWHIAIYDSDGVAFTDPLTDEVLDVWAWSPDSTWAAGPGDRRAKAREYVEAFAGRELTDDEVNEMIDNGLEEALEGKTALASFEITTSDQGTERLKVIKLRPNRQRPEPQAAAPAPQPEPEPPAQPRRPTPLEAASSARSAAAASARQQVARAGGGRQARIDDDDPPF